MKASHLNLISVTSVLSFLSAPLSPSSWGLCVLGWGWGRQATHIYRDIWGNWSLFKQTTKIKCMCIIFSEDQIQTCFFWQFKQPKLYLDTTVEIMKTGHFLEVLDLFCSAQAGIRIGLVRSSTPEPKTEQTLSLAMANGMQYSVKVKDGGHDHDHNQGPDRPAFREMDISTCSHLSVSLQLYQCSIVYTDRIFNHYQYWIKTPKPSAVKKEIR